MTALLFAARSLVRQPARAALGIVGVAAVGALLFDMLLLSNGLVLSMRDLLNRQAFDVRVTATDSPPGAGPPIENAPATAAALASVPSVRSVTTIRLAEAVFERAGGARSSGWVQGAGGNGARPWTMLRGRDATGFGEIVLSDLAARRMNVSPGATMTVRASCSDTPGAPPPLELLVTGTASFPFDAADDVSAAEVAGMYATHVRGRLVGMTDRCVRAETCLYTVAAGSRFIVDRHSASDRVLVASPCSGHGFKHSAALGEAMAELVLTGKSRLDLAPFALTA